MTTAGSSLPASALATPLVLAHVVGSPEFYWALVAEGSLLLWTALLLLAPRWSPNARSPRFRLVGLGAALLASLVTLIGKLLEVWPGNPLFPSGHTAYAVTIALFLAAVDRRWMYVVVPLAGLLVAALILANYHVTLDIAGGVAVAVVVFTVVRWARRKAEGGSGSADGQAVINTREAT